MNLKNIVYYTIVYADFCKNTNWKNYYIRS